MAPRTSGLSSTTRRIGLLGMLFPATSVLPNRLDLELDRDGVTHEHAPGLERLVPDQAEVAAVDLGSRGEPDHLEALGIAPPPFQLRVEHDRAGRPAAGQ